MRAIIQNDELAERWLNSLIHVPSQVVYSVAWKVYQDFVGRTGKELIEEAWKDLQLPEIHAKLIIYRAFIEERLDAPKHLARKVHDLYFNPPFEEFAPRTMWSLSNAFTSAFKELEPIPQFKATAKLGAFLGATQPATP